MREIVAMEGTEIYFVDKIIITNLNDSTACLIFLMHLFDNVRKGKRENY